MAVKLGFTAFGGPAAHIAMLRQEAVERRGWLDDKHFVDLLGITNLIPGPNSTELVIHVGYERAGWRGLIAAGLGFILPAASITVALAWLYVEYGTRPAARDVLYGIQPVIIAIVVQALWNLGKTALKGPWQIGIAVAIVGFYLIGVNEILLLAAGALAPLGIRLLRQGNGQVTAFGIAPLGAVGSGLAAIAVAADAAVSYSALRIFLTFLKIGSVLYGSGYVLLAFLRSDFVERYGWLTEQQLLDAVAVGQFTPGPVFTTATFVGYVTGGFWGATLATVGIFLPAFVLVALTNPLLPRLRQSPTIVALLDGVNVAAIGLMAAVSITLGRAAIVDVWTAALAVGAFVLLLRYKINSAWLVLIGGAAGLLRYLLTS